MWQPKVIYLSPFVRRSFAMYCFANKFPVCSFFGTSFVPFSLFHCWVSSTCRQSTESFPRRRSLFPWCSKRICGFSLACMCNIIRKMADMLLAVWPLGWFLLIRCSLRHIYFSKPFPIYNCGQLIGLTRKHVDFLVEFADFYLIFAFSTDHFWCGISKCALKYVT